MQENEKQDDPKKHGKFGNSQSLLINIVMQQGSNFFLGLLL